MNDIKNTSNEIIDQNADIDEIKRIILESVHPSKLSSDGTEISVRCPYCGDSIKHPNSTHFGISLKPPFAFHCYRCSASGVLNSDVLRDLQIYNNDLNLDIRRANKRMSPIIKKSSYKSNKKLNFDYSDNDISKYNTAYFNSRYDTDLPAEYITNKFKCVIDADTFFSNNNIFVPHVKFDFTRAVGFVSSDESYIIFRDSTNQQDMRYYNLSINKDKNFVTSKMYSIRQKIDLLQPKNTLVITEGIFDIIGVYEHFYKNTLKENNTIFAAACGKGYASVIMHFINMGFLDLNIEIYSDKDVEPVYFRNMIKQSDYLKQMHYTIYYNTLEKDFGIPKKQINLRRMKI